MNSPLIIDFQDTVVRVARFFEGTVTGYRPTRRVFHAGMLRKTLLCIFITVDGGPSHGSHSSLNGRSFRICHRRRACLDEPLSRWPRKDREEKRKEKKGRGRSGTSTIRDRFLSSLPCVTLLESLAFSLQQRQRANESEYKQLGIVSRSSRWGDIITVFIRFDKNWTPLERDGSIFFRKVNQYLVNEHTN